MNEAQVNGTILEVLKKGEGDPVVLIHGSASDYRTWQIPQDRLSKDYEVISYSRRFHWPNAPIIEGEDYAMPQHVDDLQALIKSLDLGPVHLVGHSYGAFLAILLAIREPKLIRSLVLAEPPLVTFFVSNTPKPRELLKLLFTRPRAARGIIQFGVSGVAPATKALESGDVESAIRHFGIATLGKKAFESLSEPRMGQVRANFIKAELLGSGFAPLKDCEVRAVTIPSLLIESQSSPKLFHPLLDRLEELLPNSSRVMIPNSSHIMHEDNPEAYCEAVQRFLSE